MKADLHGTGGNYNFTTRQPSTSEYVKAERQISAKDGVVSQMPRAMVMWQVVGEWTTLCSPRICGARKSQAC